LLAFEKPSFASERTAVTKDAACAISGEASALALSTTTVGVFGA
jgi:hypothetical protein